MSKYLAIIAAMSLCGCQKEATPSPSQRPDRFKLIHSERDFLEHRNVYVDQKTGRQYLWMKIGYSGGLTIMPEEAKP